MVCKACSYDSTTNKDEQDWEFWEYKDVNFEFERQEFTDEVEIMNGRMFVCPKCMTVQIQPTEIRKISGERE